MRVTRGNTRARTPLGPRMSLLFAPIQIRDVEALVSKPGTLKESLLGISFLKRLRSYEFSGDFLTLRI